HQRNSNTIDIQTSAKFKHQRHSNISEIQTPAKFKHQRNSNISEIVTMSERADKRSLWQVAEIFGWPQDDLRRVKNFYLQPSILEPFVDYFYNWRLRGGLKLGYKAKKVAKLALEVLQGETDWWMDNMEDILNPPVGDCDVWFTVIVVQACRERSGVWEGRANDDLEAMVNDAVQITKILNKQFEGLPKRGMYGADLPREMFKEAQKLGWNLDLGVEFPDRPSQGAKLRKR
ncbi:hypothetical protein N431DRAFT_513940, partial [Stipitochalara longipes BDJ]